jgi:hypothetical protein
MEALEKGLSSESLVNVTPKESRIVLVQASWVVKTSTLVSSDNSIQVLLEQFCFTHLLLRDTLLICIAITQKHDARDPRKLRNNIY